MSLFDEALWATTVDEMQEVMNKANKYIGQHAPIEQEAYLVYGYADGWLQAKREGNRKLHEHMMTHEDYKESFQTRMEKARGRRD